METGATILCTELDWLNGVAGSKSVDKVLLGDGEHAGVPWGFGRRRLPCHCFRRVQLQLNRLLIVYLMLAEV